MSDIWTPDKQAEEFWKGGGVRASLEEFLPELSERYGCINWTIKERREVETKEEQGLELRFYWANSKEPGKDDVIRVLCFLVTREKYPQFTREASREFIGELVGELTRAEQEAKVALEDERIAKAWSPDTAPDYMEFFLGWRCWRLLGKPPWIGPAGMPAYGGWNGGEEVEAQCGATRGHTRAPAPGCDCGFNCSHTADEAWARYARVGGVALGAVAARGVLEVHGDGFRAQYARPIGLVAPRVKVTKTFVDKVTLGPAGFALAGERTEEEDLFEPDRSWLDQLAATAKGMGVPLMDRDDLASYAAEFAVPVPDDARPKGPLA